jgi:hypothetical protein
MDNERYSPWTCHGVIKLILIKIEFIESDIRPQSVIHSITSFVVPTAVSVTVFPMVSVTIPTTIAVIVPSSVVFHKTAKTCNKKDNGQY